MNNDNNNQHKQEECKGSRWGKWDLHIHSNTSFGTDYGAGNTDEKFIEALEEMGDYAVVGINDYCVFDGYFAV